MPKYKQITMQYDTNGACLTRPSSVLMGAESVLFIEHRALVDALEILEEVIYILNKQDYTPEIYDTIEEIKQFRQEIEGNNE